ncbi:barnase inhibitor [Photorhabdus noenieputensis]|uniref:barstar family protein n=1 Tax=Photorhabdus noenieputensis TaxID=1208607 RepID=UPI001BD355CE|nr:barstar family protein [Photorhabdus noenieputensis]MBS9439963.1 barnase inhibitor [Photorhabdus noenieputensis]MCK3668312.1 barstar family protein [Photorhabdus noenieputensis]
MSENIVILDGKSISTEADFHHEISKKLMFGDYYGNNLNALWDRLSCDIERPITIIWADSNHSCQCLGDKFEKIVGIFNRVKQQDIDFDFDDKFDYQLR